MGVGVGEYKRDTKYRSRAERKEGMLLLLSLLVVLLQYVDACNDEVTWSTHEEKVSVSCLRCSSTTPSTTWYMNGEVVEIDGKYSEEIDPDGNPILIINDATIYDEGNYTCTGISSPKEIYGE